MVVITFEAFVAICCFLETSKGEIVPVHVLKALVKWRFSSVHPSPLNKVDMSGHLHPLAT